jgi:arylsulfatase A-like enzyme
MKRRFFLPAGAVLAVSGFLLGSSVKAAAAPPPHEPPPNVLLIISDGLSPDLPAAPGTGAPTMPNLRRLMARGVWFNHAYCAGPSCGPSRTALLTGVYPSRSGVYYNTQSFRRATSWIAGVATLPQQFLRHGYLTAGYGLIAHHRGVDEDSSYSPGFWRIYDRPDQVRWTEKALLGQVIPGTRVHMQTKSWDWGVLPDDWDRDDPAKQQQDTQFANDTIAVVQRTHDRPFFVTCGFWRPHVGWIVPERYFRQFPLDKIELPAGYRANDLADVPGPGRWIATHRHEHQFIVEHGLWKKSIQAYYASVAYMDDQLGRVLDALEHGPNRDNTIVVFTTDHGWHSGEKDHWSKFALWDQASRVALAIARPGQTARVCDAPVSLVDLYPTLLSLCNLPRPDTHTLDGRDLTPFLDGTHRGENPPVVVTFGRGNHAVCGERFHYIRYRDGSEELYDRSADPHEWHNLAGDAAFADVKAALRRYLPASDAPTIRYADGDPPVDSNGWSDEAFRSAPGPNPSKSP